MTANPFRSGPFWCLWVLHPKVALLPAGEIVELQLGGTLGLAGGKPLLATHLAAVIDGDHGCAALAAHTAVA